MKRQFIKILSCLSAAAVLASAAVFAANAATGENEAALPSSFSAADQGWMTPIQQQTGNTCWAYAAMSALESKLLSSGLQDVDLSENHLLMWATKRSNDLGWQRTPTDFGYATISPGYMTSWQGGVLISDLGSYPLDSSVKGDEVPTDLARYGVTGIRYLYKQSPEDVKRAVYENGGAVVSFAYTASCLGTDNRSYYMPESYNGTYTGHQVELIGWDDNYPAENFANSTGKLPASNGAWLIKNSWGISSGDSGLIWISYEDKNVLHSRFAPNIAITEFMELSDSVSLLQNEIYGATYEFGYIQQNELTFINRFSLDSEYDVLDKVVFETECAGADYTVYLVPDESGAPSSDTSSWTELSSGVVPYAGYICDDFEDFDLSGESASIAVSIDASSLSRTATLGVGEWLVSSTPSNYVFINESELGQSYIYRNGTMTDIMDYYNNERNDSIGGTFVIKGIVRKSEKPFYGDVNLDGKVDVTDATAVQRYSAGIEGLTEEQLVRANVTGDEHVNVTDATQIQKYAAGLITSFPVEQ